MTATSTGQTRSNRIRSLLEEYYDHPYQSYDSGSTYNYGYREEPTRSGTSMDPRRIRSIEMQLRRKNPDLLDKLKFAMSDRDYSTLIKELAKGAFWSAAILGAPYLMGPLVAAHAVYASRQKQIERRNMGIKPRYHLEPDDEY